MLQENSNLLGYTRQRQVGQFSGQAQLLPSASAAPSMPTERGNPVYKGTWLVTANKMGALVFKASHELDISDSQDSALRNT